MITPLGVASFSKVLWDANQFANDAWQPVFIKLEAGERVGFVGSCGRHHVHVVDAIDRQAVELASVRFPDPASEDSRRDFVAALCAKEETLGFWVYLPWERRVAHMLGPDEFFEVVTNRNRDKVTTEEQRRLRTMRIGVLGLSVGGEAAVTLAQEHLCGRIALADFDTLELANLNRIGASITELGQNKARITARRVARIDPYIDVEIFERGVTPDNVAEFLEGLDLLVEECDDLQLKWDIRQLARARRLDVVYGGDERGFLSVEPYRHAAELLPFHGRIPERPGGRSDYSTQRAFAAALTEWLGGWNSVSERSRSSIDQLGRSLCGYPQLAGEARVVAGQVAHVARRLLLGERVAPFLGHLDLETLIPATADGSAVLRRIE